MTNQFDTKVARLAKRYKGLSRVAAALNDLYIYGIYESNFPHLMEILNSAKDHIKVVIKDTKEEILGPVNAPIFKLNQKYKIDNSENSLPKLWFKKRNIMEIFPPRDKLIGMFAVRLKNIG